MGGGGRWRVVVKDASEESLRRQCYGSNDLFGCLLPGNPRSEEGRRKRGIASEGST